MCLFKHANTHDVPKDFEECQQPSEVYPHSPGAEAPPPRFNSCLKSKIKDLNSRL